MEAIEEIALSETLKLRGIATVLPASDYHLSPDLILPFVAAAESASGRSIELLCFENGPPEHIVLHGLEKTPVVLSVRQIGLLHRLRQLEAEMFDGPGLRERLAEGMALATMAEFFLPHGPVPFAAYAFMRSRITDEKTIFGDVRALGGARHDLVELLAEPRNENSVCCLFYGLAHELGHVQQSQPTGASTRPPWCDDHELITLVERVAATMKGSSGRLFCTNGPASSLHPRKLRLEANADIEAARMLARVTPPMMRECDLGRPPDASCFVAALLATVFSMGFIAACRRQVAVLLHEGDFTSELLDLLQRPIAFAARQALLRSHTPMILCDLFGAIHDMPPTELDALPADLTARLTGVWDNEFERFLPVAMALDAGLLRAMAALEPGNFTVAGYDQVFEAWRNKRLYPVDPATVLFMRLAHSMALSEERLMDLHRLLLVNDEEFMAIHSTSSSNLLDYILGGTADYR